jgi:hypothetical protein
MIRPPKLYIHHVGARGANTDFPKTVDAPVEVERIVEAIKDQSEEMALEVANMLTHLFPCDRCNAWGVPARAISVLRNLAEGDYVLLIRSISNGGEIPVLGCVKYILPCTSPALSLALWQKEKYPLIFFFDSEALTLRWVTFCFHVGYRHYDPRGRFLAVSDRRLMKLGGTKAYVSMLRKTHGSGLLRFPDQQGNESAIRRNQEAG